MKKSKPLECILSYLERGPESDESMRAVTKVKHRVVENIR